MNDQAALYRRLTETVWVCLHGDPPCRPSGRCSDGCSFQPSSPVSRTMENEQ